MKKTNYNPTQIFIVVLFVLLLTAAFVLEFDKKESVQELMSYIVASVEQCEERGERGERNLCLDDLSQTLIAKAPFLEIDEALIESGLDCHDLMHFIAQKEYKRSDGLADTYNKCSFSCFGACYHGAVEGYFEEKINEGVLMENIETSLLSACPKDYGGNNFIYGQCLHGTGHALMFITASELPRSLELCDTLSEQTERENCYGGVFMENAPTSKLNPHPTRFIKKDDPLYPCNSIDKKYERSCYTYQVQYFLYLSAGDLAKTAALCESIPEEHQPECFKRIGSGLPGQFASYEGLGEACSLMPDIASQKQCIEGVVDSFADRYGGDREKMLDVFAFCSEIDEKFHQTCYEQVGILINKFIYDYSEKKTVCGRTPEEFQSSCLDQITIQ